MITKKDLQKQIVALQDEVKKLKDIVVTEELKRLRIVEKQYQEQTDLLSKVHFKIKNVKVVSEDEENPTSVTIIYQLPMITLDLDENGVPKEKNEFFYSVNALGMISQSDCDMLTDTFEKVKNSISLKK